MHPLLTNTTLRKLGASSDLVVILHGYTHTARDMQPVVDLVRETHPDADILCPDYPAGLAANTDPGVVARELEILIDEVHEPQHARVILLGHSAGGLLLRKALVLGRVASREWALRTERIVLLAGINRGWSLDERPGQMRRSTFALYRVGIAALALIGRGRFIRALRRGTPFIAGLRLDWIRLERSSGDAMPLTVQVLGTRDDIVSPRDSIDVQSGRHFRYVEVRDTGHLDIVRLDAPVLGAVRRAAIRGALLKTPSELSAGPGAQLGPIGVDETITDFVFIRHGIRDFGHWTRRLAERVRAIGVSVNLAVESETSGYGYFPMGPFLIWSRRQTHVRRFLDEYVGAVAKYPAARMHFIGHSNGTYLLAGALHDCEPVRFGNIVLAGSVMPTWYPWNDIGAVQKRVSAVRNHVGSADWVVAIFPRFYEFIRQLTGLRWASLDIGSAGFNDFQEDFGNRNSVAFARGGHGGAMGRDNADSIAQFALTGNAAVPATVTTGTQSSLVTLLGRLCWLVWVVIAALIILGAWVIAVNFGVWWMTGYALVVFLLLNSL